MKLIITGGYGFIGSNFINIASKFGHDILNIDNVTYAANMDNIRVDNIDNIEIDIADYNRIEPVILDFSPDAVIHFAAESHVDNSIANPHIFLNTNIYAEALKIIPLKKPALEIKVIKSNQSKRYFIKGDNFNVIKKYNNSDFYALVIGELANKIKY